MLSAFTSRTPVLFGPSSSVKIDSCDVMCVCVRLMQVWWVQLHMFVMLCLFVPLFLLYHFSLLQSALIHCFPRNKTYNLPQTRGRIYILVVQKGLLEPAQLDGFLHLVHHIFPSQIPAGCTVDEARRYVRSVHTEDELVHCPPSQALGL